MQTGPIGRLALIGRLGSDGEAFSASWLRHSGHPDSVLAHLAVIWEQTFARDTEALTARLLADNWNNLDPDTTTTAEHAVGGVGVTDDQLSAPVQQNLGDGWKKLAGHEVAHGTWLYLLDTRRGEVSAYEAVWHFEWQGYACIPLADLATPAAQANLPSMQTCGPLRQWAAEDQIVRHIPALAGFPPHLLHLALAVLGEGRTAVIHAETRESGTVWLPGGGHLIRVLASVDHGSGTAILPRPLSGPNLAAPPAVLVSAFQVADACQGLKELLEDLMAFHAGLQVMAQVGHDAADNVAEWWAQDTIGSRASGDCVAAARRILTGIDDGDPAVLDALPPIPIDTDDTTRSNGTLVEIYEERVQFGLVYPRPWDELSAFQRDRLLDALVVGFESRFHDAVATQCRLVIGPA
ncbi:hypothetical protein AB0M43_14580 [Longispora sp. NPDC051575]|uniref:hypothetical protein n=1 Tax=Longispora sp. NPDC051575 TaxID=3154943 RepID=UPI00342A78B4